MPLGDEFLFLSGEFGRNGGLAIDGEGDFVAAYWWFFYVHLVARGWSDGSPLPSFHPSGGEDAWASAVATVAPGDFAVSWTQVDQNTFEENVFFARFAPDGTPLRPAQQINPTPMATYAAQTAIAARPGGVVVVWEEDPDIKARFVPYRGPPPAPITVNTSGGSRLESPRAAATADGRSLIAWYSDACPPDDPSAGCIRARHFDAAGTPTGVEFMVNVDTTGEQDSPAVAATAAGFVVAWRSEVCSTRCIRGRLFDAEGLPSTGELELDEPGAELTESPWVAAAHEGFLVTWVRSNEGDGAPVARLFDAAGRPLGGELAVSGDPPRFDPFQTRVAANEAGEFVVTWNDDYELWARRFQLALFLDGFESGDTSAWDQTVP